MRPLTTRAMPALGEEFRSAREARGLTLSDVAEQIHIRSVYLNAIENDDWPQIGAPVYVRGFIRTYARFLGLDAESAVARFNETAPAERPAAPAAAATSVARESSGPSLWAVIGGLIALLLVAFVGYEWWQYSQSAANRPLATASPAAVVQPTPSPNALGSAAPAAVSGTASPSPSPKPLGAHQLALRLTQRSWLRAAVDGHTVMEGLYPAGTSKTLTGKIVDLRVGNAGGVTVTVNGGPAKPLGKDGDVVEQRYTL